MVARTAVSRQVRAFTRELGRSILKMTYDGKHIRICSGTGAELMDKD